MREQPEPRPWTSVEDALQRIRTSDTGPRRHFVVLGAGVAGLAAGLELMALGHTVTIIEGSDRVGGRVQTRRFFDGSYGELGAMRIPGEHDYTYHYLRQTQLERELRPFPSSHPNGLAALRGVVCPWTDEAFRTHVLPLFPELPWHERAAFAEVGPGGLLGALMEPLFEGLSSPQRQALLAGDFSDPQLYALDQLSWLDYLRDRAGASAAALEIFGAWLGLRMPWQWSMAAILRDELTHTTDKLVEIAGGLDRLPVAMAARLPAHAIRFHTAVHGLERRGSDGGVVHLRDSHTGEASSISFGQLLCTLPFPVLGKLPMGLGGFSAAKLAAIRGLGDDYSTATKILFQYSHRWWETAPYEIAGGRSMSEGVALQTYYPTPDTATPQQMKAALAAPGKRRRFALYTGDSAETLAARTAALAQAGRSHTPGVLLASYTYNELAQDLGAMNDEAASALVLARLRELHPDMVAAEDHVLWCWDHSPWAGKAFALTRPGTLSRYFQDSARPEGQIYFAGEHVSIAPAWIQGALESSLREVARMVRWPPQEEQGDDPRG